MLITSPLLNKKPWKRFYQLKESKYLYDSVTLNQQYCTQPSVVWGVQAPAESCSTNIILGFRHQTLILIYPTLLLVINPFRK